MLIVFSFLPHLRKNVKCVIMKLTDVSQMSDGISEIKEIIENGF